jgi:hypothetical protein
LRSWRWELSREEANSGKFRTAPDKVFSAQLPISQGVYSDGTSSQLLWYWADFQFRPNEWFLYEYDFGDGWQHVVRVERRLSPEPRRTYPVCVGGQRAAPPEDCGGPGAFLGRRDAVPGQVREHLERILEGVEAGDREAVGDELEAVESLREWLALDRFDRRAVNRRLRLYAEGDERWREEPSAHPPHQPRPLRART